MQVGRRRKGARRGGREGGRARGESVEMTKSYIAVSANWVIFPHCFLPLESAKSRRTRGFA